MLFSFLFIFSLFSFNNQSLHSFSGKPLLHLYIYSFNFASFVFLRAKKQKEKERNKEINCTNNFPQSVIFTLYKRSSPLKATVMTRSSSRHWSSILWRPKLWIPSPSPSGRWLGRSSIIQFGQKVEIVIKYI